jgi:hypothetical protein
MNCHRKEESTVVHCEPLWKMVAMVIHYWTIIEERKTQWFICEPLWKHSRYSSSSLNYHIGKEDTVVHCEPLWKHIHYGSSLLNCHSGKEGTVVHCEPLWKHSREWLWRERLHTMSWWNVLTELNWLCSKLTAHSRLICCKLYPGSTSIYPAATG